MSSLTTAYINWIDDIFSLDNLRSATGTLEKVAEWPVPAHWSQPSTYLPYATASHISVVLLLAVILTWARNYIQRTTRAEASGRIARGTESPQEAERNLVKYTESTWKLMYYGAATISGWLILTMNDWTTGDGSTMWRYMRDEAVGISTITLPQQLFVMTQLAFYLHSLYAHVVVETHRSDYWQMLIHHVATIALIGCSYFAGWYRITITILALHDVSDVLLEAAKLCVYRNEEFLANILFAAFVVSWVVFRLVLFPFGVLHATWVTLPATAGICPMWLALNGLLFVLQLLHIIWFVMILKLLIKLAAGGKAEDTREKKRA